MSEKGKSDDNGLGEAIDEATDFLSNDETHRPLSTDEEIIKQYPGEKEPSPLNEKQREAMKKINQTGEG